MPRKSLSVAPTGREVRWIDQRVPFQCSASGTVVPARLVKLPTAVQTVAFVHEMPNKSLSLAPVGCGVRSLDQLTPSQRSASIRSLCVRDV
jgi:hypothetical protein